MQTILNETGPCKNTYIEYVLENSAFFCELNAKCSISIVYVLRSHIRAICTYGISKCKQVLHLRTALFWDITPRSAVVLHRRFWTTYRVPSSRVKKSKLLGLLDPWLGGPKRRCGHFGEQKNCLALSEFWTPDRPPLTLVTIPTTLCRLQDLSIY